MSERPAAEEITADELESCADFLAENEGRIGTPSDLDGFVRWLRARAGYVRHRQLFDDHFALMHDETHATAPLAGDQDADGPEGHRDDNDAQGGDQ